MEKVLSEAGMLAHAYKPSQYCRGWMEQEDHELETSLGYITWWSLAPDDTGRIYVLIPDIWGEISLFHY